MKSTLGMSKEINQRLTNRNVDPVYQAHYYNPLTGESGRRGLIRDILRDHHAVWPGGIQSPADRAAAIAVAMFREEIVTESQIRFTGGSTRYAPSSIWGCLAREMPDVGQIQLTEKEDSPRHCDRPRCKWYLKD
jgi:hypothetical protein